MWKQKAAAATLLVLLSGCGSGPAAATAPPATPEGAGLTITARALPGVGTVLVTGEGYAVYVFTPDHHRAVTCTGACTGIWPPLMLPAGAAVQAGPGVRQSLLGSLPDPAGGRVVTYAGWPLYGYSGDVTPGQANGQDIDLNGGYWYVMRPSGQPLTAAP